MRCHGHGAAVFITPEAMNEANRTPLWWPQRNAMRYPSLARVAQDQSHGPAMLVFCAALDCTNTSSSRNNVVFHYYRRENLALQWAAAEKRDTFKPWKTIMLCSDNFYGNDYHQSLSIDLSIWYMLISKQLFFEVV